MSCGAYGQEDEGRLISCVQCGQSYHPYCVEVKVGCALHPESWICSVCVLQGCSVYGNRCSKCDSLSALQINKVILNKGWRCLDCTVCEGCGKPHDEGRLILCDECDISYHIYCLDPPLDHVPKGTWKCKW